MSSVLVKVTTYSPPPPATLLSTNADGSQVWRTYVWDPAAERWQAKVVSRPAPPKPPLPARPPIWVPPPEVLVPMTPLPEPAIRWVGVNIFGFTSPATAAYQDRVQAWLAANPGKTFMQAMLEMPE